MVKTKIMANTPFKLRSGNQAAYNDLQKESPIKNTFFSAIGKVITGAGKGIAKTTKETVKFAKDNPELTGDLLTSVSTTDDKTVPIVENKQKDIV